jgi:hypothetical protein
LRRVRPELEGFEELPDQQSKKVGEFLESFEIYAKLRALAAEETAKYDTIAILNALTSVLRSIAREMGSPTGGRNSCLVTERRDMVLRFPAEERYYKAAFQRFSSEQRDLGHSLSAIFRAFKHMYTYTGRHFIEAANFEIRSFKWSQYQVPWSSPEYRAKLREVGLRSADESDDEAGERNVFIALSPDHYPMGVVGWWNAADELFISRILQFPHSDSATAVSDIQEKKWGVELILGSEANDLLRKIEQVEGTKFRGCRNITASSTLPPRL